MRPLSTIFFIYIFWQQADAQTPTVSLAHWKKNQLKNKFDSIEEAFEKKTQFQLQSGFMNKVIFAGRDFGVNQSGATLGALYHHRSGINIESSGNYWSGMPNRYALTEVGAYYEKPLAENFYLSSGYWHLFYHNGEKEERNEFTNFFMFDGSWYHPLAFINISYYFIKGNEAAHRLDVNLSKSLDFYRLLGADKISIDPTFTVTFATVNYLIFLSSLIFPSIENDGNFKIGNYEFSLPVTYKKFGKFEINTAWHYAMPVPFSEEEKVHPISYFTIGIARTLYLHKSLK